MSENSQNQGGGNVVSIMARSQTMRPEAYREFVKLHDELVDAVESGVDHWTSPDLVIKPDTRIEFEQLGLTNVTEKNHRWANAVLHRPEGQAYVVHAVLQDKYGRYWVLTEDPLEAPDTGHEARLRCAQKDHAKVLDFIGAQLNDDEEESLEELIGLAEQATDSELSEVWNKHYVAHVRKMIDNWANGDQWKKQQALIRARVEPE